MALLGYQASGKLGRARRQGRRRWDRGVAAYIEGLSEERLNAVLNLACRRRQLDGLPSPD